MLSKNCWKTFPKHLHGYVRYDETNWIEIKTALVFAVKPQYIHHALLLPKEYLTANIPINYS